MLGPDKILQQYLYFAEGKKRRKKEKAGAAAESRTGRRLGFGVLLLIPFCLASFIGICLCFWESHV